MNMRELIAVFIAILMLFALLPFAVVVGRAIAEKMKKYWNPKPDSEDSESNKK